MSKSSSPSVEASSAESWLEVVGRAVAAIRFGSVQVTVHEGRVTQVEAVQRTRFQTAGPQSPGRPGRG